MYTQTFTYLGTWTRPSVAFLTGVGTQEEVPPTPGVAGGVGEGSGVSIRVPEPPTEDGNWVCVCVCVCVRAYGCAINTERGSRGILEMCVSRGLGLVLRAPPGEVSRHSIIMSWGLPRWSEWERTCLPMQETQVRSLGREDPLEKGMATHSSIPAWRTLPRTEEPGRLQTRGSHRVGHDWATNTNAGELNSEIQSAAKLRKQPSGIIHAKSMAQGPVPTSETSTADKRMETHAQGHCEITYESTWTSVGRTKG